MNSTEILKRKNCISCGSDIIIGWDVIYGDNTFSFCSKCKKARDDYIEKIKTGKFDKIHAKWLEELMQNKKNPNKLNYEKLEEK